MIWSGGCLCGALRYRADAAPVRVVICHCSICRRVSGAPMLCFVHFPKRAFAWLADEPLRHRSSPHAERGFCPRCGSTLTRHEPVIADRVQVTLGSLWLRIDAKPPRFPWISSAVPSRALDDQPGE